MARYISSQVIFWQQDLFYKPTFRLIKETVGSSRYLKYQRKTTKGKILYKYWERTACIECDMAKIIGKW